MENERNIWIVSSSPKQSNLVTLNFMGPRKKNYQISEDLRCQGKNI